MSQEKTTGTAMPATPPRYEEATAGLWYSAHAEMPTSFGWEDRNIRRAFIRKVYTILMVQLCVTLAIVVLFTFCEPVKVYIQANPGWYWGSYVLFFITYLTLSCCSGPRRKFPWNLILLVIFLMLLHYRAASLRHHMFAQSYYSKMPPETQTLDKVSVKTLSLSYMTGMLSSFYNTKSVMICLGITALVCLSVTIFSFHTKFDLTSCQGVLFVLAMVVLYSGLILLIVLPFGYVPWLHAIYAALGAIVFTMFLVFDTQLLMGNKRYSISPEEYIFAALNIYLDIIYIFSFILQLIGLQHD